MPASGRAATGEKERSRLQIRPERGHWRVNLCATKKNHDVLLFPAFHRGFLVVDGKELESLTPCTSSMRSNWVEYFPVVVIVLYIDIVIFFNVQSAHKCIYIIPQYHDMSTKIASQYPKKENHGRSRIIFPNLRKKWGGRLKKGALPPV